MNTLEMQLMESNVTQGKFFDRPGEVFHCFDRQVCRKMTEK